MVTIDITINNYTIINIRVFIRVISSINIKEKEWKAKMNKKMRKKWKIGHSICIKGILVNISIPITIVTISI